MDKIINVAILGAGNIANAMAEAVKGIPNEAKLYAVASRSLEKAQAFAEKWGVEKAYGSYEDMVKDENIDLIYVASPHSEHYKNTKLCLENGRNCLVEKAFCGNLVQTKELLKLAKEKDLLLAEAMWTRYQPSYGFIKGILESGIIGKINYCEDDFAINVRGLDRMEKPELAGGALLDLGIYSLTVPAMYWGYDIASVKTDCELSEQGVDLHDDIVITYKNGNKARVKCAFDTQNPANYAKFVGDKGSVVFGPINVPTELTVYDNDGNVVEKHDIPLLVNGYEYEVISCRKALLEGANEVPELPHSEICRMMSWMDSIRNHIGMVYPFETKEDINHADIDVWGVENVYAD